MLPKYPVNEWSYKLTYITIKFYSFIKVNFNNIENAYYIALSKNSAQTRMFIKIHRESLWGNMFNVNNVTDLYRFICYIFMDDFMLFLYTFQNMYSL